MTLWMDETPPVDPSVLPPVLIRMDSGGMVSVGRYTGRVPRPISVSELAGETGRIITMSFRTSNPEEAELPQLEVDEVIEVEYSTYKSSNLATHNFFMKVFHIRTDSFEVQYDFIPIGVDDCDSLRRSL
jgi:hypothetical protein